MKKLLLFVLLVLFIPTIAFADISPVAISGYSVQATKGSEVVLSIKGTENMNGTLKYNKDELKYVSMRVDDPAVIEGEELNGSLKITKNNPGELSFKYQQFVEDGHLTEPNLEDVLIKFVVLKVPSSKKINIQYIPDNKDVLYGEKSYTYSFVIREPNDKVSTKDDTNLGEWVNNPKPYVPEKEDNDCNCNDNEDDDTTDESDDKNECPTCECPAVEENKCKDSENSTLLYVSWAISGVLLIVLIVLLMKNKKKIQS